MTLTPFLILILAGYALFIATLGWVSIWSKGGARKAQATKASPDQPAAAAASGSHPASQPIGE